MKTHLANKVISGFSTILSITLLCTCIWTLTSLLIQDHHHEIKKKNCETSCFNYKYDTDDGCNETGSFDDEQTGAIIVENEEIPKLRSFWTKFDEMNKIFKRIIISCLSLAMVGSLVQLISSGIMIFSLPFRMVSRSRIIVIIFFVIFIVFLSCLAWPLAYKRDYSEEDEDSGPAMHTVSTLTQAFKDFIACFKIKNMIRDFHLYYIVLFVNIIFLFVYMVITCCLLRCTDYEEYDN